MSTTIKVICYKSKKLSNDEHPLMLRVTKDRKRKYVSLGISVHPKHWDFDKEALKPNCPNKDLILNIIDRKTMEYRKQSLEFQNIDKDFSAQKLVDIHTVSEGGISDTFVDVRLILQAALLSNASSIILAHNHPSGSLIPSHNDSTSTKMIKEAAKLMNINVDDHLIVGKENYYSFADEGIL